MVELGLKEKGYEYVIVGDGWMQSTRDKNNNLQVSKSFATTTYPSIKSLADKVNGMGLKFGLVAGAGSKTCKGGAGSLGYETQDAK